MQDDDELMKEGPRGSAVTDYCVSIIDHCNECYEKAKNFLGKVTLVMPSIDAWTNKSLPFGINMNDSFYLFEVFLFQPVLNSDVFRICSISFGYLSTRTLLQVGSLMHLLSLLSDSETDRCLYRKLRFP
jgi:hypothetical protein